MNLLGGQIDLLGEQMPHTVNQLFTSPTGCILSIDYAFLKGKGRAYASGPTTLI